MSSLTDRIKKAAEGPKRGIAANKKWVKAIQELLDEQIRLIEGGELDEPLSFRAMHGLLKGDKKLKFTRAESTLSKYVKTAETERWEKLTR